MTPEDLVSRLAPVRVPEDFARFSLQDALAVIALGLLGGLLLSILLRGLTRPRPRAIHQTRARITALSGLAPQERVAGLALLLRDLGEDLPPQMRMALYDPGAPAEPIVLEAAILASARRRGR